LLSYNRTGISTNWKHWLSMLTPTTCKPCKDNHGKIFSIEEDTQAHIPMHFYCKCRIEPMRTIETGNATYSGMFGADVFLKRFGILPEQYISKKAAEKAGWDHRKGNLAEVLPERMIGGDIYKNKEEKLPDADFRIWYEADINYSFGYRNKARLLFSNDGLIFATYDHYETFYEVVGKEA